MAAITGERRALITGFVLRHPHGWQHEDWEGLLGTLRQRDLVRPGEEDAIGLELERARVMHLLASLDVRGLGPKRREAVAAAFPRAHELRNASAEALSELPTMNRSVAGALVSALH